jgi:protein-S-isoprenylcysteine O-methyltransferase Ste14
MKKASTPKELMLGIAFALLGILIMLLNNNLVDEPQVWIVGIQLAVTIIGIVLVIIGIRKNAKQHSVQGVTSKSKHVDVV